MAVEVRVAAGSRELKPVEVAFATTLEPPDDYSSPEIPQRVQKFMFERDLLKRNLAGLASAFLAVLVLAHPHPAAAASASGGELCPVASDRLNRSVSYRNTPISAPKIAEETAALRTTVQSGEGEPRAIAIMRLAMAGDLNAFRLLLASADADGLYIYASRYLNSDDTVCINPEMESAVLEGLRDPGLGRGLVGLFP